MGGEKGKWGRARGMALTSGDGGFMMVLHAVVTESCADLFRVSALTRFGWWASICERERLEPRGSGGRFSTCKKENEGHARRVGRRGLGGLYTSHPDLPERPLGRQEVGAVEHPLSDVRAQSVWAASV